MMIEHPVVDIGRCTLCMGCVEVAPSAFRYSEAAGFIEVIECSNYSREEVDEAITICPVSCIFWEK